MALLEVEGLRTTFRTPDGDLTAVDGVSFEVFNGETLGIVGESGSGKSVTALSLMGLVPSATTEGKVQFGGRDLLLLSEPEMRKLRGSQIAMIFQDPMSSLNPVLTIARQLMEVITLHTSVNRAAARAKAIDLLEIVNIPEAERRIDDYPHQFSGGMRQRVMIAMALACDPLLILADEITTALDVTIQAQVLALLKRLAVERNTAFVMITHDLGVVAGMTDRVLVMYAGQIVEVATTKELFARPKMPYTWGLLESIPRLDRDRNQPLIPIEGAPPDLANPPAGCRFIDRCRYARDICRESPPALAQPLDVSDGHFSRCWGTQDVEGGGWLTGPDARRESAKTPLEAS